MTNLEADQVQVWSLSISRSEDPALPSLEILSQRERERAARFVQPRDRAAYVWAHTLLRDTLSRYADVPPADWRFETSESGKPRLAAAHDSRLSFSLTHTRGLVACAVGVDCEVGVDVEALGQQASAAIEQLALAPSERLALAECPPADQAQWLLELWTLKEAYLKATGEGLLTAPDLVAFERASGAIALLSMPPAALRSWRFEVFAPAPDYTLAVAVGGTRTPAPAIQFNAAL